MDSAKQPATSVAGLRMGSGRRRARRWDDVRLGSNSLGVGRSRFGSAAGRESGNVNDGSAAGSNVRLEDVVRGALGRPALQNLCSVCRGYSDQSGRIRPGQYIRSLAAVCRRVLSGRCPGASGPGISLDPLPENFSVRMLDRILCVVFRVVEFLRTGARANQFPLLSKCTKSIRNTAPKKIALTVGGHGCGNVTPKLSALVKASFISPLHFLWIFPCVTPSCWI